MAQQIDRERKWSTEEVNARNAKVSAAHEEICRIARLSPHGKHGIDFFDLITHVYLAGSDAGDAAGYKRGLEDAAKFCENEGAREACAVAQDLRALAEKEE